MRIQTVMVTLGMATLLVAGVGCKKKTTTTSGDVKPTPPLAKAGAEDPAAGTGLPDPAEVETMSLERVHFGFDAATLSTEAKDTLTRNAEILRENPTVKVRVEGHADSRGSTEYNLALGERRANAVRDFLVTLGVPAGNLVVVSLGEEKPLNPAENEAAWAENRRAESIVIEGSDRVVGSAK